MTGSQPIRPLLNISAASDACRGPQCHSDIKGMQHLLSSLSPLAQVRLTTSTGSLHCGPTVSHATRHLLDVEGDCWRWSRVPAAASFPVHG